jgi:hypothetical protein
MTTTTLPLSAGLIVISYRNINDFLYVRRFYLLPKIHKENNLGRPNVSANDHPNEKISEFIDFHLRPLVENLPSHIKDITDYLKKMETS